MSEIIRPTSSIPPLSTIQDTNTRRVLEALVTGWRTRNGDLKPDSDDRFISKGELSALVTDINNGYFKTGPGRNLLPSPVDQSYLDAVEILNAVLRSPMWTKLGERITLINETLSGEILGLTTELNTAAQDILNLEDGTTDIAIKNDDGSFTTVRALKSTVYDPNTGLAAATAAIGEINNVSTTSTSAAAKRIASLVAQVNNPDTGLAVANANITAINKVDVTSTSANARALAGVQATITDDTTGLAAAHSAIASLNNVTADSTSATARYLFSVGAEVGQKNKVFFQTDAPASTSSYTLKVNDIWFDSDDKNRQYNWNGSSWVESSDGRISATQTAITNEASTRVSQDNVLASAINTLWGAIGDNSFLIQQGESGVATVAGVTAQRWNQTQAAIKDSDGNYISTAAVREETKAVASRAGDIEAQWSIKTDVNGYVAGIGLMTTAKDDKATSDFIVRADRFAIQSPTGNKAALVMTNNVLIVYDEAGTPRVRIGSLS